jgi:hypothetical protein
MYFNSAFRKTLLGTTVSGDTSKTQTNILVAGIASPNTTKVAASTPSTGFVTFTTDAVHGLVVGDQVVISGTTGSTGYNGTYTVTSVPTTTKFVVASTETGASPGGTIVINCLKTTVNLTAGSIGLYKQDFTPLNWSTVDGTTSKVPFYLVQGSYYKNSGYSDKIGSHGGYQESVKSKMINPKYISRIFWVQAKAPVQQVVQIPLTAQSGSTNVGLNADTTYRLRIDVKGSPALRFLSHNIYRVMDTYTGPVNATTPSLLKDPVATLVDFKEQLTMSPYLNQLVQARVYVNKGTPYVTFGTITAGTAPSTVGTAVATITTSNTAGSIYVGQRITGGGLPANSFVTATTAIASAAASGGTWGTITTTSMIYSGTTIGGFVVGTFAVGTPVTGTGIPAGSYVSAGSGTTTITITYPTQASAPSAPSASVTVSGISAFTISYPYQPNGAPSLTNSSSTTNIKVYNDVYGVNGGYVTPYTNIAVTAGQQPTYEGQTPYIPGSSAYTTGTAQTAGTATGATIAAASTAAAATSGAHTYTAAADAASFATDAFLELTAAYLETKFGNPTFTISDNYDLEPLKIIASLMDDSGSTTVVAPIGTAALQTIGEAGIATVAQASSMAQGTGEMVLRELILTGRYRQEAFGDGTNIDQFRMREIEANPGVMDMMTVAKRNGLYNKLCILHNVPRFNNPTSVFDNDQYLIEIAVPNTVAFSNLFTTTFTVTSGSTYTSLSGNGLGDFILESSSANGGAQFVEII